MREQSLFDRTPGYVRRDATDTSARAALSIAEFGPTMRTAILSYVVARRAEGATCDEIEQALNLRHQTASARVRELVELGLLTVTPARRMTRSRRTAQVYVA